MGHSRYVRQRTGFAPVAAEVLEQRALLSSAAAAVHTATHHAAIEHSATTGIQVGFKAATTANIFVGGLNFLAVPGTISVAKFGAGATSVSVKFTFSFSSGGEKVSVKGSFVGKITNAFFVPPAADFTLQPTSGSVSFNFKSAGSKALKATALPNGTASDLFVATPTTFHSMTITDAFKPGSPGGLSGQSITIAMGG